MSHTREVIAMHEGHGEEAICAECYVHWPCQAEQLRAVKEEAWDEGERTGRSRAMRMMSDEPGLSLIAPNPYRKAEA